MATEKILVPESLQETLWRLEEVRYGFRNKSSAKAKEALQWVLTRQGLPGSYLGMFMPTDRDLHRGLKLLTGERIRSSAAIRHILSEEALRTAIVWGLGEASAVGQALKGFDQIMERGARSSGRYCCYNCTIAFLRTLVVVKPKDWNQTLEKGLNRIRRARTDDGKWHGFPFYYTILTLSEMSTPLAEAELKHASVNAEKLLKRYRGNDRASLFRRLTLESMLRNT